MNNLYKVRKRFNLILLFIFGTVLLTVAQLPEDVQDSVSVGIRVRQPEEQFLQQFREDPAFNYFTVQSGPSLWDRLKWWIWRHLNLNISSSGDNFWLQLILEGMALALVILLIYWLVKRKYLKRKSRNAVAEVVDLKEQLDDISYPGLVEQAVVAGNYSLAVRIHYLYILRLLDEKEIIHWDVHRTNLSYYYEIKGEKLREHFRKLIRIFDCVCYGEFQVDKDLYCSLEQEFNAFRKEITV